MCDLEDSDQLYLGNMFFFKDLFDFVDGDIVLACLINMWEFVTKEMKSFKRLKTYLPPL